MKSLHSAIIGLSLLTGAPVAHADVVTDWNQTAIEVMSAANVAGNPWTRSMAMMHVAMSDAVNAVESRYARFAATVPSAPQASSDAAASAAAREMLVRLYPGQKARVAEAYAASLATIAEGPAKHDGVRLGEQIAAALYADRANDATNVPDTYRPITNPGVWIPTAPPLFPQYATAKPWGLQNADQFRPAPPPPLSSAVYARDFNETKELGAAGSTKRTPEQVEAVRFWNQNNLAPAWFQAARQLSAAKGFGLADNARLFALLSMGLADAFITDWDAKFHYNSWRPITAIRNGDKDGNAATERDPGWMPMNATPMHPEYPSQAGINVGATAGILEAVFGTGPVNFTVWDIGDQRLQRQFTSIAQMGEEQRMVRIWGGIHFRNSLEVGTAMGRKIADNLLRKYLTPTQRTADAAH